MTTDDHGIGTAGRSRRARLVICPSLSVAAGHALQSRRCAAPPCGCPAVGAVQDRCLFTPHRYGIETGETVLVQVANDETRLALARKAIERDGAA